MLQNIILYLAAVISSYKNNETIQEKVWLTFKILMIMNALNGA